MATIFQFQKKLAGIANEEYLKKLALDQLKKFEEDLVKLNKQALSDGESYEGDVFGIYTRSTEEIAQSTSPAPREDKKAGTRYNFEWTGGLFDNMHLVVSNEYLELWSSDKKAPLLNIEYPGLFGVQQDKLSALIFEKVYPLIMRELRKKLGI